MNSLFCKLFLISAFTYVICDNEADVECNKRGSEALEGKSDQELYDLTQENLKIGEKMVLKRAEIANSNGLICYQKFYDKYTKGLEDILLNGEKERLDRAKTPEERSGAIKAIAGITQGMRCDEDWRAKHFNETIKSAECSALEQNTCALQFLNFRPKLALLENGMFLGKFALKFKNNVMSGIVGELLQLYSTLYSDGEKCSKSLSTSAQKCHNLKMFVKELDRLYYLFALQLEAKIF